jgi:histidinol-phosphate aminotransferase
LAGTGRGLQVRGKAALFWLISQSMKKLIRPLVQRLHAYVPGEQPRIAGLIKLNTNENPYPPSPGVLRAVKAAVDGDLRLYPNPTAQALRERLAKLHKCGAENVTVGNGSDELLAMAVRAFVEPARGRVQWFSPSYSLYPVIAKRTARARQRSARIGFRSLRSRNSGGLRGGPSTRTSRSSRLPTAPSGRGYLTRELDALCRAARRVIPRRSLCGLRVRDALRLALEHPHVLISRTFSKGYSLCFQRVGYFVGPAALIAALDKIRDSYNVNGLGQLAALATLEDLPYYRNNTRKIIATRTRLSAQLEQLGFGVLPSESNFIFARTPRFPAREWLAELRKRKILVRWFDSPATRDYLRITIGTDAEARTVVRAAKDILR